MKNKWVKIGVYVVVGYFALGVIKDMLIKSAVTVGASHVIGAPVKIDSFALRVLGQSVRIKGFKMYQPQGFDKEVLIDIPEIRVDYDLFALLRGQIHLPKIVLNLKEMVLIKNKDGVLNVDTLKVAQAQEAPEKPKKEEPAAKKQKSQDINMQIDVAQLNLGQVIYKDYSKADKPTVYGYDIGIKDKTYKDIKSAQEFATLVMVQSMGPAALKGAKIYAAAAILGAGFLPVGIASVLISEDSAKGEFKAEVVEVHAAAIRAAQELGEIKSQEPEQYIVNAVIDGADVEIQVTKGYSRKSAVHVIARKMMVPKAQIARGVVYYVTKLLNE